MRGSKANALTLAEKCKNIVASNWQAQLNTIKADGKGSKEDVYSSKAKYILKKGKPYIWVPEKDMHNLNIIIDERASLAISSPFPGPLAKLLSSVKRLPARVALTGDVMAIQDEKIEVLDDCRVDYGGLRNVLTRIHWLNPECTILAKLVAESLKEVLRIEQRVLSESSYSVSGVLSSSNVFTTSRRENLKELVDGGEKFHIYRFNPSSYMFIDGYGRTHEMDPEDIERSKADLFASFSANLIDGINQSEERRRALILFCLTYLKANARDAYMLSVDRKGFDVLGKVHGPVMNEGTGEYQWKEFRFTFKEEAHDIETFCHRLVEMEEEAVYKVSSNSGLA